MIWQHEYNKDGNAVQFWHHVWEQTGKKPPPLEKLPDLDSYQTALIHHFHELMDSRRDGVIPLTEIEAYSRIFQVREPAKFCRFIRAMNRTELTARHENSEKKGKK